MADSCTCNASGHNYRYSSFIVDVAMGQILRSTYAFLVSFVSISVFFCIFVFVYVGYHVYFNC